MTRLVDADRSFHDGWWLHQMRRVDSTNELASTLPAWHAVRADLQSAGRGRTGRHWVSDDGGLWLSAVLPCPLDEPVWQFLPLAVGWGVGRALENLGVKRLRLRWPNDLMVDQLKLAGVLVERFDRNTAVVGVGMNISNTPEALDQMLVGATTRLRDLLPVAPLIEAATFIVLGGIRAAYEALQTTGFAPVARDLNARWLVSRRVELTLAGPLPVVRGRLLGIDERGALRLADEAGAETSYDATQVALLREIQT
jgi:BirA family biotin operon repressor/biotin-[acetyl-CoA-carboxylase] ligase